MNLGQPLFLSNNLLFGGDYFLPNTSWIYYLFRVYSIGYRLTHGNGLSRRWQHVQHVIKYITNSFGLLVNAGS